MLKSQLHFRKLQPRWSLFEDKSLVVMVSVVTLLLQLISFVTTWNGSKIYLDGTFPYASLLFALAIQVTAYFFSNSLRGRVNFLKLLALFAALCCSTYYSYIGIYNSVNSPVSYLQENYVRIRQELTQTFQEEVEITLSSALESVNDATSLITAEYSSLIGEQQTISACRDALAAIESSYVSGMRPPKQSAYENYKDYAAAYQAYINSASQGSNTENEALRSNVLSSYGYASIEELNAAEQKNTASLAALTSALQTLPASATSQNSEYNFASFSYSTENTGMPSSGIEATISALYVQLSNAINAANTGQTLDEDATASLNKLLMTAKLCGYEAGSLSQLINAINQCAQASATPLMADYPALVSALPEGIVTSANTMELKNTMDSEILSALIKINSLLPKKEQLIQDAYKITDLYLIPIKALQSADTRMTAFFSLAVAALIDALSVLFAASLRERKPLWKKQTLLFNKLDDYAPLIYASLPATRSYGSETAALYEFLAYFQPSPQTENDGYMLKAPMDALVGYSTLTALLCQTNLAKLVPAGLSDNERDVLLLRARFVFWANSMIYEEKILRNEAVYE